VDNPIIVYGGRGTGSGVVEAALTLLGLPDDAVDAPRIVDVYR
jgi:hypothetical protein